MQRINKWYLWKRTIKSFVATMITKMTLGITKNIISKTKTNVFFPIIVSIVSIIRLDEYNHLSYFVKTLSQCGLLVNCNSTYFALLKMHILIFYNVMHNFPINAMRG